MKEVWDMWTAKEQSRDFGRWVTITVFEDDSKTFLKLQLNPGNPLHGKTQETLYVMNGADQTRFKNKAESIGWAYQTMMDLVSQQGASLISAELTETNTTSESLKPPHLVTSLSFPYKESAGLRVPK